MKAVVIREPGTPDVLRLLDVPDPEPDEGEVRIRVEAAGINRADLLQRQGRYPAPEGWPDDIPGLEYAGRVDAVGDRVSMWSPGDRVMGLVGGGAYAEYAVVPADQVIPVPDGMEATMAAAIPEAFITAHDALRTRLGVRSGETVLIHAIGSGVGTAALQLARAFGARVIGTSRTAWKLERARQLGLEEAVLADQGRFSTAVLAATSDLGVNAIVELVGGDYLEEDLQCVRPFGRIVVVGLTRGRSAELDMGTLLRKRLTIVGTVLRSRSNAEKAAAVRSFAEEGLPFLARGTAAPVVDRILPMADAAEGHTLMESNDTFGKIVLAW